MRERKKTNGGAAYICENQHGKSSVEEIIFSSYRGIRFSSILFKRDILKIISEKYPDFFSSDFTTLDIGFFYILAFYGKLFAIDEYTTVYRIQSNSVSINSDSLKQIRFAMGVYNINCYFLKEFGFPPDIIHKYIRNITGPTINKTIRKDPHRDFSKLISLWKKYNYKPSLVHRLLITLSKNRHTNKLLISLLNK